MTAVFAGNEIYSKIQFLLLKYLHVSHPSLLNGVAKKF